MELFLVQHRFFVEPACGASLAAIYDGYKNNLKLGDGPIIPIVFGGKIMHYHKVPCQIKIQMDNFEWTFV